MLTDTVGCRSCEKAPFGAFFFVLLSRGSCAEWLYPRDLEVVVFFFDLLDGEALGVARGFGFENECIAAEFSGGVHEFEVYLEEHFDSYQVKGLSVFQVSHGWIVVCEVKCVKVVLSERSSVEHSFAVRIHKPLAFAMEVGDVSRVPCSCWVVLQGEKPVVQDLFS